MIEFIGYEMSALNIEAKVRGEQLIQGSWQKNGHEMACLLGAIHADVNSSADACAATGMPDWMGFLVPALFDGLPKKDIHNYGLKFATSMRGWGVLDDKNWGSILTKFKIFTVRQALEFARPKGPIPDYWQAVESACLKTIDALRGGDKDALADAAVAAADAAYAARAAADAARAAAYAALAADAADADAALAAAYAARAADAADAAAAAYAAAAAVAARAAQFDALLEFISQEIEVIEV
jgi:hypothetical protein